MQNGINSNLRRAIVLILLVILSACSSTVNSPIAKEAIETTKIYIVRHAEKANGSRDPQLSPIGRQRANQLAVVLNDVDIDKLWSSDYQRTRQTLAPLSKRLGLAITVYDAGNSQGLISAIFEADAGKTHVIAGHSNTVPELVDLFEAWPAKLISKEARPNLGHNEYDRLYEVTVVAGRGALVNERRY